MPQDAEITFGAPVASSEDDLGDEYESVGDHHRAAARHFDAAARHHLAAADAEEEGNSDTADRHAYLAYRQRLNGVQYAETALMDSERVADVIESNL